MIKKPKTPTHYFDEINLTNKRDLEELEILFDDTARDAKQVGFFSFDEIRNALQVYCKECKAHSMPFYVAQSFISGMLEASVILRKRISSPVNNK